LGDIWLEFANEWLFILDKGVIVTDCEMCASMFLPWSACLR